MVLAPAANGVAGAAETLKSPALAPPMLTEFRLSGVVPVLVRTKLSWAGGEPSVATPKSVPSVTLVVAPPSSIT
jgi:hypothetical protein